LNPFFAHSLSAIFRGDQKQQNFAAFIENHHHHPVIGIYNLKDKQQANHYGVIRLNREKKIIDFQEKPLHPKSTLVAMCLYYFPKEKLNLIGKYLEVKTNKSDATGFYIDWLRQEEKVYGYIFSGHWYDIGHHQFYAEARKTFSTKHSF